MESSPRDQMSFHARPETLFWRMEVPALTLLQTSPFQWRKVPLWPTAHASVFELAQTPPRFHCSARSRTAATVVQEVPLKRRVSPLMPVAQTSVGETTWSARRSSVTFVVILSQAEPFHRTTVP